MHVFVSCAKPKSTEDWIIFFLVSRTESRNMQFSDGMMNYTGMSRGQFQSGLLEWGVTDAERLMEYLTGHEKFLFDFN